MNPMVASVGATDAPMAPAGDVREWRRTIIAAARIAGWRTASIPRRTIDNDTPGFPDLVLVHGGAARIWFVKLRRDGVARALGPGTALWGETIIAAGGVWRLISCPSGLDAFRADLVDAVRPT